MNGYLKQLARDQLAELSRHLASPLVCFVAMDDNAKGVNRLAVDEHVELDEVVGSVSVELVIYACISASYGLQAVVEIEDDLRQRKFPLKSNPLGVDVLHANVRAAPFAPEVHDAPDVVRRRSDAGLHIGFFHSIYVGASRHLGRVLDPFHLAVCEIHLVFHVGHGGDEFQIELTFETLAHDVHM